MRSPLSKDLSKGKSVHQSNQYIDIFISVQVVVSKKISLNTNESCNMKQIKSNNKEGGVKRKRTKNQRIFVYLHRRIPFLSEPFDVFTGLYANSHGLIDFFDGIFMLSFDLNKNNLLFVCLLSLLNQGLLNRVESKTKMSEIWPKRKGLNVKRDVSYQATSGLFFHVLEYAFFSNMNCNSLP